MAEAFLRSFDPQLRVESAGTAPAPEVNPHAVRVMEEAGIDISLSTPKNVTEFLDQPFDYVITVCDDAEENCPRFHGKVGERLHFGFPDPAKATGTEQQVIAAFRTVRDQIRERFADFHKQIAPR